jgi:hypothetical protein
MRPVRLSAQSACRLLPHMLAGPRAVLADIGQLLTAFPRHYDLLLIKAQAEMNARNAQVAIATLEELSSLEPERVSVRKMRRLPARARTLARSQCTAPVCRAPRHAVSSPGWARRGAQRRILAETALSRAVRHREWRCWATCSTSRTSRRSWQSSCPPRPAPPRLAPPALGLD